jgi:hypothetical protein
MGAFDMGSNLSDPSDDSVANFSSRGPTIGGRKKPDLAGSGINVYADRLWQVHNDLWDSRLSGTSFAAPQAAGAAALLGGSGVTDPLAEKAVLINSARAGRATPSSPMGTQTTWQPDWGWGELNLTDALAQRTNFGTTTVASYGARFYRATTTAAGDRATLAWNRRGTACLQAGCQAQMLTLSNLDLQQLDANTGALQAQSTSNIDNVEQVRSPGPGQVVYKVKAVSNVDGLPAEPFALAATTAVTPLATPQPITSLQVSSTQLKPGQTATVTASARNPSADLTAQSAQLALAVPPGVQIVSSAQTQSLGTLATSGAAGDTAAATWTVRATADVTGEMSATASASRYGETFSSAASSPMTVDGTPPSPAVAAPAGSTTSARIPVSWSASDDGSGVDHYDVEVSADDGPYTKWLTATREVSGIYLGLVGSSYRFRVRAADRMGNLSTYAVSSQLALLSPPNGAQPPTGGASTPPGDGGGREIVVASPGLRLTGTKRKRGVLTVRGLIAPNASSRIGLTYLAKVGSRTYTARGKATPTGGRFKATLRISQRASRARRGTLVIRYGGGNGFRAQTVRVRVAF